LALTTASARRNDHGQQWQGVAVIRCLAVSGLRYTNSPLHTVCSTFYLLSSIVCTPILPSPSPLESQSLDHLEKKYTRTFSNKRLTPRSQTYIQIHQRRKSRPDGRTHSIRSIPPVCGALLHMTTPHESSNVRFLPTQITTLNHTIHTRPPSRPEIARYILPSRF
jgi:hypothetical protein